MKIFLSNKSKQKINFQHTVISNYFKIKLKTVDFNVLQLTSKWIRTFSQSVNRLNLLSTFENNNFCHSECDRSFLVIPCHSFGLQTVCVLLGKTLSGFKH